MILKKALKQAQERLSALGYGKQSAFMLLLFLLNKEAHEAYMSDEEELSEEILLAYEAGIKRLESGEPLSHIIGYEYFYGYNIKVNSDVLIPRCETEELVGYILQDYDTYFKDQDIVVADIGTGSGAIAIALKKEEERMHLIATDISSAAIKVAYESASSNDAIICFCLGDMLEPLIDRNIKVDILISNPPYIPQAEKLEASVFDFEPHVALFGGADGCDYYRKIFKDAHKVLNEKAILAFEMGYQQKDTLVKLAKDTFEKCCVEVIKDMSGKDRMMFVRIGLK